MRNWVNLAGFLAIAVVLSTSGGCMLFPDVRHKPRYHNPFPQLKRVAVLPFFNQSDDPTLDMDQVTAAYYAELQAIPGFEVLPTSVVNVQWRGFLRQAQQSEIAVDGQLFQKFAQQLGAEAVVVGSVTDYSPYYPPRMAMTVHWYAANPGFHPIPPGYGLPWGTRGEDKIPNWVVQESEAELARQQLATQSPVVPIPGPLSPAAPGGGAVGTGVIGTVAAQQAIAGDDGQPSLNDASNTLPTPPGNQAIGNQATGAAATAIAGMAAASTLPAAWPDPTGLIPDGPLPSAPLATPQHEPVLTHTRIYHATDADFTERLAAYFELRDDARFGGWQNYLARSDDFVRFCCYVHITDMLELRGGRDKSDLILRWPLNRYTR